MCTLETRPSRETITTSPLVGYFEAPIVVSVDANCAFDFAVEKYPSSDHRGTPTCHRRQSLKVQNLHDWVAPNATPLQPLITEAVIIEGQTEAADLINMFAAKILEQVLEYVVDDPRIKEENESDKEEDTDPNRKAMVKYMTELKATKTIVDYCDNIIDFFSKLSQ